MIKIRAILEMFGKTKDAETGVKKVNDQLLDAEKNAKRVNKTLSETQVGQGAMGRAGVSSPGNSRDYRTQRGVTGTRGASGRNFAAMAQGGDGQGLVAAYATLAANIFTLTAGFQALSNAAKTEQLAAGLELVGARAGVALGITAKGLQEVTGFGISAAESMRAVAQATAAGFSGKEIEEIGKVAKGASVALGRDLGDAMDRLIKGTIKLEPELLDELGIMTRLDDAVRAYALENGKAVSALTQTERRQAFLNAVLAEGASKFGDISDQIPINPYDKLAASMKDLGTQVLSFANSVLIPFAKLITEVPVLGIALALGPLAQALSKVTPSLDSFYNKVEGRKAKLAARQDFVAGLIPDAQETLKGTKEGSAEQLQAKKELIRLQNQELNLQTRIGAQAQQTRVIENFRETIRRQGIFSAIKELAISQKNILSVKTAMSEEEVQQRKQAINAQFAITSKAKGYWWANKERIAAEATLAADRARLTVNAGITAMTKIRVGLTAIGGVASFLMASLSKVLIVLTIISAVVGVAVAAFKFFFPPSELKKRLDEAKEKMKELAEQASKTADQINLMLEPGKQQQGLAFDAIVNSIKAANVELENFARLKKETEELKTVSVKYLQDDPSGSGMQLEFTKKGNEAMALAEGEFKERFKASGFEDVETDLILKQYKLLLSTAEAQERVNALRGATPELVLAELQGVEAIKIAFLDLEESAKSIRKFTKDLIPKEPENAMRDLATEFEALNNFSKEAAKINNPFLKETAFIGIAKNAAQLQPELKNILTILNAQGVSVQNQASYMTAIEGISEAQLELNLATQNGDEELKKKAQDKLDKAYAEYTSKQAIFELTEKELALQIKLTSFKQDVLTYSNERIKLEEKLNRLQMSNTKSALEYNKAIQDAQFLATGAEISVPEEFSYEYNKNIAELEYNNAKKIAELRKESVQIELALQQITMENQQAIILGKIQELEKNTEFRVSVTDLYNDEGKLNSYETLKQLASSLLETSAQDLLIQEYLLAVSYQKSGILNKIAKQEESSIDSETNKGKAVLTTAEAKLQASQKEASINIRNLKYIDEELKSQTKINKTKNAYLDNLSSQSKVLGDFSQILNLEILPGLGSQLEILSNQIILQNDSLAVAKEQGKPERIQLEQQKLTLLKNQKLELVEQVNSVLDQAGAYEIAYSAQNSLLKEGETITRQMLTAESIRLDIADKNLEATRKELQLRIQLKDAVLATQRAEATAQAAREGRSLTPREEREFEKTALENQLKSLQGFIEKDSKGGLINQKGEIDLLIDKKQNEIDRVKLEAEILKIRMGASQLELETAIARAKSTNKEAIERGETAPISQASIDAGQSALDSITSGKINELMKTNLASALAAIDTTYGLDLKILEEKVKTVQAELKGILTTRERRLANIAEIERNSQNSVATFGMTEKGGAQYLDEMEEINALSKSGMAPAGTDFSKMEKEARMVANALSLAETAAAGLNNVLSTIQSSVTDAFMSLVDGSKDAKQAFGDMAISILKSIADMITQMLVMRLIQSTMGIFGVSAPIAPAAASAPTASTLARSFAPTIGAANGGIIALANGGIMDARGGLQGIVSKPTYLVGEGRYNEAVVPLPNGRSIPVQMHGGGSQSNNVSVNVNMTNNGSQTQMEGQDPAKLGQAVAAAVQRELVAQKAPGGLLNRYSAI